MSQSNAQVVQTLLATIVAAFLCAQGHAARAQQAPIFGMNFSFNAVDVAKIDQCKTSRSSTVRHSAFLPRYDQPEVRENVKQSLAEMKASGFKAIRTLIFFGEPSRSKDWFDSKRDRDRAARNVRDYIDDVAAAGFQQVALVYGVQGESSPSCRKEQWGDCFRPDTLASTNAFISSVRAALGPKPPLPIIYDIGNEMCAPPNLPALLKETVGRYVLSVASNYRKAFPNDDTTVSCSLLRFGAGQPRTDAIFSEAGGGPGYYEIHSYKRPSYNTGAVLDKILSMQDRPKRPFVIGETTYGDKAYVEEIIAAFRRHNAPLHAVYFWPLAEASNNCTADVPLPYTLQSALGGR